MSSLAILGIGFGVIMSKPAPAAPATTTKDVVIADFENTNFANWTVEGTAFGSGPVGDDRTTRLEITNVVGRAVASSERDGDASTGVITSAPFAVQRKYIAFHIAGGDYEYSTCVNLLVDDKIVRTATGWNSDRLTPVSWDVSEFAGKSVRVQLVDVATGEWGHLNVDHIIQTDAPEALPTAVAPLYTEALRPQFHFTARQWAMNRLNPDQRQEGWLNDLNGLIFYEGEYHLFAQRWNKCWIHAVSKDLIHWTELAPAFWEESLGSGVQSGTCVIDYGNTSGLSPDKNKPAMVAFWSRNDNQSHCISYSLDNGRTWKHYDKNPVLAFPERDPKVFRDEARDRWVMMMYGSGKYHLFTSKNLIDWSKTGEPISDTFECPDFFELPIDGDVKNTRWVLVRADGRYSLGTFDETGFKAESDLFVSDIGPNFYATQTWENTETVKGEGAGRRVQTAWMRAPNFPDMPFNQQVSFPCELSLHTTPGGVRMFRKPINEIEKLHVRTESWAAQTLADGRRIPLAPTGDLFRLKAEVAIPAGAKLIVDVRGTSVIYHADAMESGGARGQAGETIKNIELLIDRASIEAFANDGELSSTRFFLPGGNGISIRAEGGSVDIKLLQLFPLRSAWRPE